MSTSFDSYVAALDELRLLRESGHDSDAEEDRLADRLERLWLTLDHAEQERARALSWRAWPDEFAKISATSLRDLDVWDREHVSPPRQRAAEAA